MNFENMPELKWHLGYPMAIGLMLAVSVVLCVISRHRDWI